MNAWSARTIGTAGTVSIATTMATTMTVYQKHDYHIINNLKLYGRKVIQCRAREILYYLSDAGSIGGMRLTFI